MDWYPLALFAHILGVLGLFMALAVELASMLGARRARTIEAVRVWSSVSKPLEMVFPLMSLLILCAGLAMTLGVWGWGHAWIDVSLALLILLSVVGATVNGGMPNGSPGSQPSSGTVRFPQSSRAKSPTPPIGPRSSTW